MTLESIEKYTQAYDYPAGYPWVRDMVDDIEREVTRRYMELPVDADGVPIRPGTFCEECPLPDVMGEGFDVGYTLEWLEGGAE